MGRKGGWNCQVTPELCHDMETTAHAAYKNGSNLRQDALTLFGACRYPRTVALAILAEEEFSKALILMSCADEKQGKWDSNLHMALRKHPEKQGIVEGIIEHTIWFVNHAKFIEALNRRSLFHVRPSTLPSDDKMNEIKSKVKSYFKKPIRDKLKQDSIYVNIDKFAKASSNPNQFGKEDAKGCLDRSLITEVVTEVALGDDSNVEYLMNL